MAPAYLVKLYLVLLLLISPAFLAVSISRERETGCLEQLWLTPLRPARIIGGKLVSGLARAGAMAAAVVVTYTPLALAAEWSWRMAGQLLVSYTTMAVCLVLALTISLLVSSRVRTSVTAPPLAYLFCLVIFSGLAGLAWLVSYLFDLDLSQGLICFFSPFTAFFYNLERPAEASPFTLHWAANIILWTLISLGCYLLTTVSLAHSMGPAGERNAP
jgi:ABC-type Na+ efflux pump permease subunit